MLFNLSLPPRGLLFADNYLFLTYLTDPLFYPLDSILYSLLSTTYSPFSIPIDS